MGTPERVAILVSILALIPGFYAAYNTFRARRQEKENIVYKNYQELLQENREESKQLRTKLIEANKTIDELTGKLTLAHRTITQLNNDLGEANTELVALRGQIESMSKQVDGESNGRN